MLRQDTFSHVNIWRTREFQGRPLSAELSITRNKNKSECLEQSEAGRGREEKLRRAK